MLEAFSEERKEGQVCRHVDGNKKNNASTNLKWGTVAENIADRAIHGTTPRGEGHYNSRIKDSDVIDMFRLHRKGVSQKQIAKRFDVSQSNGSRILSRKTWNHIQETDR